MGYIVDIEELHDNQDVIIGQLEQWSSAFAGLSEAENTYIMNTEVFGGQAAQAAKEYVSAVHQTLGGTYCQLFDETRSLLLLYVDGYQAIEDSINGRISEESLEEQQRLIQREQQTLSEIDGQIKGAIASVAHIVSVINPDAESMIQNYTLMSTFLSELDGKIKAYEESHANDMDRVGELLDGISRVMDIHKGTDVHIAPYSDIQTYEGVQLLTLINKIGEGDPTLISAAERVNSLYDEFCTNRISEERMEKGAKAVVGGSLLVLTGIVTAVFISRTAGAAIIGKGGTIVMGAASYVAVTHGTSNTIEGFQEYRYGKSRDTESVAINYVRDYVYLGNERLYNGVTTVGETVCGAYLTGMYGCMYSQACGIPLWKGELIQGGITLASGEVGTFVSDKVSTLDINPWFKATAGPVAGVATFGVANAAATRYIVPSIKQANVIGNVESNRSITEIAKTDIENFGYECEYKIIIKNRFPNEPIPSNGYKLDYYISDGSIKGIEGRKGSYDFVITKDNELMIGSKHHYLGNTEDVIAAGQIKINGRGMVKRIDNLSGHYQPSVYQAMQYQGLFEQQGLKLQNTWIEYYSIPEVTSGYCGEAKLDYVNLIRGE